MSTKNDKYSFIEQSFKTSENQYYNLNLNQSKKCAKLISVQLNSKPNNDKYCGLKNCCCSSKKIKSSKTNLLNEKVDLFFSLRFNDEAFKSGTAAADFIVSHNYEEKEKLQSRNKFSKISVFTTLNEYEKQWKNENTLKTTNKSTLSLHIAAYENSIKATGSDLFGNENIVELKKEKFGSIKTLKQCFFSLKSRNPFEFPRQQNGDQRNKSEVMQFKASQQLLLLADDLTPSMAQASTATTTLSKSEKLIQENWWILVIGIILMIIVGAGLLFLGYKCSGENRTRKSEKESRRVTLE